VTARSAAREAAVAAMIATAVEDVVTGLVTAPVQGAEAEEVALTETGVEVEVASATNVASVVIWHVTAMVDTEEDAAGAGAGAVAHAKIAAAHAETVAAAAAVTGRAPLPQTETKALSAHHPPQIPKCSWGCLRRGPNTSIGWTVVPKQLNVH
jgi:hypothetical protein